jgi:hypothetical protein
MVTRLRGSHVIVPTAKKTMFLFECGLMLFLSLDVPREIGILISFVDTPLTD